MDALLAQAREKPGGAKAAPKRPRATVVMRTFSHDHRPVLVLPPMRVELIAPFSRGQVQIQHIIATSATGPNGPTSYTDVLAFGEISGSGSAVAQVSEPAGTCELHRCACIDTASAIGSYW